MVGNAFVDIGEGPTYKYNPNFTSLALGDLNGDGDDEILLLRDPVIDKASLFMVNPAGHPCAVRTRHRLRGGRLETRAHR